MSVRLEEHRVRERGWYHVINGSLLTKKMGISGVFSIVATVVTWRIGMTVIEDEIG